MLERYLVIKKPYRLVRRVIKDAAEDVQLAFKVGRGAILKLLHRSDYKRWTEPRNLETWWDERTEKIVQLIPKDSRVIEFGAGRRQLEKLLDTSCFYVPSDLTGRGPGTIVCDLNQRPLPDLGFLAATVAVFGGVLEYVLDVESLVRWLSSQFPVCVASYTCVVSASSEAERIHERLKRLRYGYMNNYNEETLVSLFNKYGFVCLKRETWTNQKIFLFVRKDAATSKQPSYVR